MKRKNQKKVLKIQSGKTAMATIWSNHYTIDCQEWRKRGKMQALILIRNISVSRWMPGSSAQRAWSRFKSPRRNSRICPMFNPFQFSPLNLSVKVLIDEISIRVQIYCAVRIGESGLNCPFCVRADALHRARFCPSSSASCNQQFSNEGTFTRLNILQLKK